MKSPLKTTFASIALVAALSAASPLSAGALPGPKATREVVSADSTDTYSVIFEGLERAEIAVIGDGDTDLDLYVYDEFGNLIESDDDSTDQCYVTFFPRRTGRFTIRIVNRGSVYNRYAIVTN